MDQISWWLSSTSWFNLGHRTRSDSALSPNEPHAPNCQLDSGPNKWARPIYLCCCRCICVLDRRAKPTPLFQHGFEEGFLRGLGAGDWSARCRSEFSSLEMPAQSRISLHGHGIVSNSVRFYWIVGCDSFLIPDLNFELSSLLSLFAFDVGFSGRKRVIWMLRRRSETVSSLWNLPLQLPISSLTLVSWCWCRCCICSIIWDLFPRFLIGVCLDLSFIFPFLRAFDRINYFLFDIFRFLFKNY